jgi:hypothetical protein
MSKKLTIQGMQQLAESQGGKCLSDTYVDNRSQLLWQCAKGHQWMAVPSSIQRGSWCPFCAGRGKTIRDMRQLAAQKGGQCLSDTYVNPQSKLVWQCAKGHQWTAIPNNVQQGTWCPECSGHARSTIQHMYRLAETRGGRCLSDIYVNNQQNLLWECKEGHRWQATAGNIGAGKWCPECSGNVKLKIVEMHHLAEAKGGKCLSDIYVNSQTPLLWECGAGHRWEAIPNSIKRGSWCRVCARLSKPSMDDIQHIVGERGGRCLSQSYRNARTLMNWECMDGHQWRATWDKVSQGHWCHECSTGLGERICREFFSQLFQKSFPKTRPEWLVNEAGNQMELDGYCATLGIAFEHQGEQHYSTKTPFIGTASVLSRRQEDDALKSQLCTQRGITLVLVPEIPRLLPLDQVRAFIKEQLSIKGVHLPQDIDTRDVDINRAYRTGGSREVLNHLRTIATEHGGQCLSTDYVNDHTKLLWQCGQGHEWEAIPGSIKQGTWCPFCAGIVRKTREEMQKVAAARDGKCLSPVYVDGRKKLLWECSQGHQWQACPGGVVRGAWCPYCVGRGKTIEDMHHLAAQRGGKCLSPRFINAHTQLLWRCAEGHEWKASPDSVRRGSWCAACRSTKLTIEEMQAIAQSRGGKCLSEHYVNAQAKLLWKCSQGHRWQASGSRIKQGTWCPFCVGLGRTIEDMKNLAAQHEGQCLSDVYKNVRTKLLWQCQEGHKWEATLRRVMEGHWCPVCSKEKRRQRQREAP